MACLGRAKPVLEVSKCSVSSKSQRNENPQWLGCLPSKPPWKFPTWINTSRGGTVFRKWLKGQYCRGHISLNRWIHHIRKRSHSKDEVPTQLKKHSFTESKQSHGSGGGKGLMVTESSKAAQGKANSHPEKTGKQPKASVRPSVQPSSGHPEFICTVKSSPWWPISYTTMIPQPAGTRSRCFCVHVLY